MTENLTTFLIWAYSIKVALYVLVFILVIALFTYVTVRNRKCSQCGSKDWEEGYNPCCLRPNMKYMRTCKKCNHRWWV